MTFDWTCECGASWVLAIPDQSGICLDGRQELYELAIHHHRVLVDSGMVPPCGIVGAGSRGHVTTTRVVDGRSVVHIKRGLFGGRT